MPASRGAGYRMSVRAPTTIKSDSPAECMGMPLPWGQPGFDIAVNQGYTRSYQSVCEARAPGGDTRTTTSDVTPAVAPAPVCPSLHLGVPPAAYFRGFTLLPGAICIRGRPAAAVCSDLHPDALSDALRRGCIRLWNYDTFGSVRSDPFPRLLTPCKHWLRTPLLCCTPPTSSRVDTKIPRSRA